jgi:hypothetical protein
MATPGPCRKCRGDLLSFKAVKRPLSPILSCKKRACFQDELDNEEVNLSPARIIRQQSAAANSGNAERLRLFRTFAEGYTCTAFGQTRDGLQEWLATTNRAESHPGSAKVRKSHSMGEYVTILWVAFDLLFFVPMPLKRLHRPRKHVS